MQRVLKLSFAKLGAQDRPLTIIVPKSVLSLAHDRNRFRRIVREFFRVQVGAKLTKKWVVVACPGAKNFSNEVLRENLSKEIAKVQQNGVGSRNS